jgi:hypothetical protein
MKAFIFRITQTCDKRCPTCCCGDAKDVLDPDRYRRKLIDIDRYSKRGNGRPVIILTGGEAFLYRGKDQTGKRCTLADLCELTLKVAPTAKLVIKTAGWTPHRYLDGLLSKVTCLPADPPIEVRFGFNLYQHNGVGARERLHHMIASILHTQDILRLETIYDRTNLADTVDCIIDVLGSFGFKGGKELKACFSHPNTYLRLKIPIEWQENATESDRPAQKTILLDTMPAYEGLRHVPSDRYYEAAWESLCPAIGIGPDHILYNPDLSFYQCNDAFGDYSTAAFKPDRFQSIHEEFAFLSEGFTRIKNQIMNEQSVFNTKREQCLYCSKLMHSSAETAKFDLP